MGHTHSSLSFLILPESLGCRPGFFQRIFVPPEPHKTLLSLNFPSQRKVWGLDRELSTFLGGSIGLFSLAVPVSACSGQQRGSQPPKRTPGTQRQVITQWS